MKVKGLHPVPPSNERPSNNSKILRYKQLQDPSSTKNNVELLQVVPINGERFSKDISSPLRSRRSSNGSTTQNDGNRARISNLLKNLDKNSRKFVLENLRSMDTWNKALVDDESTDSEDSIRNTDNFQIYANPSLFSNDKTVVSTEAARQKMRKKVLLRKPKQLNGLHTNSVTQQCRNMRETTKKNKLNLVIKEMYKIQLQSELESLNAKTNNTTASFPNDITSNNISKKDQGIQLKAISCVHAWTLRAINNVIKREILKYSTHTKTKAIHLWAKRVIVRVWRRFKLYKLMDRIVSIQKNEREEYNTLLEAEEVEFIQRIKIRETAEDITSLRLKTSEYKTHNNLDCNNITTIKTNRIKSLCCQETRSDLSPFSTIINSRIVDGGFNNLIPWQIAATVTHGKSHLSANENRNKNNDTKSSVIKVIENMSRLEDYESRKKSLCTSVMRPILTIHNVEIRGIQYL